VLKVVATMEVPMSHQGAERPDVKNSLVLLPARRIRRSAGRKERRRERRTMAQSSGVTGILESPG
jgi:hypothetical protein